MAAPRKITPKPVDEATRAKLINAAGPVIAERGFHNATVREICKRAGANVAAVNYYFGGKLGLYTEVLRQSMIASTHRLVREALKKDLPPDEILRQAISVMLKSMCGGDRPNWHFRLMMHELAQPSDALPLILDEVIRPNYDSLRTIVGRILGLPPSDTRTRLCVHSIVGQVVHYSHARPVLSHLWPAFKGTPKQLDEVADHIARFSLCYLERKSK
jgi:AcrR family transcriptional regulator